MRMTARGGGMRALVIGQVGLIAHAGIRSHEARGMATAGKAMIASTTQSATQRCMLIMVRAIG